jgi:hypothetical protein
MYPRKSDFDNDFVEFNLVSRNSELKVADTFRSSSKLSKTQN